MRRLRRGIAALAVGAVLLLVPDSQTAPTLFSLVEVEESTGVDFGDEDVVVVLALGSDSEGNADAIELIALNFETGQAAAVGIPRDTVVEFDGEPSKINDGLRRGGAELMADHGGRAHRRPAAVRRHHRLRRVPGARGQRR